MKQKLSEETQFRDKRYEYDDIMKERVIRLKKSIDKMRKREDLFAKIEGA